MDSVFPLPLTTFERYMLADDQRDFPMTFVWRVELVGIPDREALDLALDTTLKFHPMLTARLSRANGEFCWLAGNGVLPALTWESSARCPPPPLGRRIDLRKEPGVQCEVHVGADAATLTCLFHHAVCDGIGGLQFIGDLFADYASRVPGSFPQAPASIPVAELLALRETFVRPAKGVTAGSSGLNGLLRTAWMMVSRRPAAIGGGRRRFGRVACASRAMPVDGLAPEKLARYRKSARELGVTLNDLLIRDAFMAMCRWRNAQRRKRRGSWLRIVIPTSLRTSEDRFLPAANKLGYAFITRHTSECSDPLRLALSIAGETRSVRAGNLGTMFIDAMSMARRVPGLLDLSARVSRRWSTLVLTNLGDPSRRLRSRLPCSNGLIQAGNLAVLRMYGVPPIRRGTRIALGVFAYAGRLTVALDADPRSFSPEQARSFLDLFMRQLVMTFDGEGEYGPIDK